MHRPQPISFGEMRSLVHKHGFRLTTIFNSTAAAEGEPLRIMGYMVSSARMSTILTVDAEGMFDQFRLSLFFDSVEYSYQKKKVRAG